ncbi:MAG: undecaprenyl-diphosphate phosphatase [Gammaproteobacteria bacterium]|nr:undecaprenyl-diphosphate phosphatase [Gammaproteobacteria bacterium]MCP5201695.1 undecaprenyl-diphosphate phosphatase [Gammaproteobacteria bacterium]
MTTFQLVVIALAQGLTEFLPISSSAHLILIPQLTGWPDQGLAFDVAAHVGSLVAVCTYFRADLVELTRHWLRSCATRQLDAPARLAWGVLLGTIPVGLVGLFGHDYIEQSLRSPLLIAATTVFFGIALWLADRLGRRRRPLGELGFGDVALIGCAQALALVPGVSRSGITMTAALAAGLTRDAGARFSFLLSIPVIVLAGGLEFVALVRAGGSHPWGQLALVTLLSALSAFACIHFFLRFIERIGMGPFAVYRLLLGGVLLAVFAL